MKKILLIVTGCIAAYKVPIIITMLRKKCPDIYIKVMTTKKALDFVTPIVLQAKADEYLNINMIGKKITHVDSVQDLDVLAVVPATANTISSIVCGKANSLALSSILATPMNVPRVIFPAMNNNMYLNIINQHNIDLLIRYQWTVVKPVFGDLACGVSGIGKLPSVSTIVDRILELKRIKIKVKEEAKDSGRWISEYVGEIFDVIKYHTNVNFIDFNTSAYTVIHPVEHSFVYIPENMCEEI
jgi:phosphopantothenoylcysteine decarboxylase/phosphopantothenate--cysteine ligase